MNEAGYDLLGRPQSEVRTRFLDSHYFVGHSKRFRVLSDSAANVKRNDLAANSLRVGDLILYPT
jgi:hypothetical protein